ncbi:MAG: hypothetical protein ABEI54_00245 [Candidatus Bipolaricaulia bacterium]
MITQLSGIFVGVLTRVFLPWIRKLKEGKVKKFDPKYLYSAVGSILLGVIVTLLVLPQFKSLGAAQPGIKSFAVAFGFGFGWHSIVNEAGKWGKVF